MAPDVSEADDAERLSVEDGRQRRLPRALVDRAIGRRNPTHDGNRQTDRELGGAVRESARRLRDDDAARGGGGEIDVIGVIPGLRDDAQIGELREELAREPRALAV